jgi:16S rRNA (guanine527-N7)-methyltransferase
LPSLGADADQALADGLRAMAIELPPAILEAIDAHARLLAAWGRRVNLTAIREPVGVIRLHVLDSLSAVALIRARMTVVRSIVDIGSGGGYPGIPVALALGAGLASLVESVGRKARFLEVVGAATSEALASEQAIDVEVLPVRAEELAGGGRRASWDVATVRAVGSVAECAELGLPLLRAGGLLVCWKGHDAASEVAVARTLIDRLGGGTPELIASGVPGSPAHRLVLVRKERPTPASYPRPPAVRRGPAARSRDPSRGTTRRS